jgi:hypothetical protein
MAHVPSALGTEDIVIPQGATESATWPTPWLYAENASAPDVPGGWPDSWNARMEIRDTYGGSLLAHVTKAGTADGVVILDTETIDEGTFARITVQIPAAVSAAWTWVDVGAVYDVELVNGPRVIRLVEGSITLSGEVTSGD